MINSKGQVRTKWNSFVDWYKPYIVENFVLQTLIERGIFGCRFDNEDQNSTVTMCQQLLDSGLVTNISPFDDLIELIPT